MRFPFFIILFALFAIALSATAQKINYVHKDVSLIRLFKEIKNQTGFRIIWNEDKLDVNDRIDVNFQNIELAAVMKAVLSKYALTFTLSAKTVIVKEIDPKISGLKTAGVVPTKFSVRGRVVDELDLPLVSANIQVKGMDRVVIADIQGRFEIQNVVEGDILKVSFLGYEGREVYASLDLGNIRLKSSTSQLQEVGIVNTGYQYIPRERVTGSFVIVDSVQLNRRVSSDLFSRLEGISGGVLFNKNTLSTDYGSLDLSIRGKSTIYANDQPLVVLDHFPYSGNFDAINPNDIANVVILKDAAAASIWGVRAGNGVIVVTTKKAQFNQPLNIVMNTNMTVATKPNLFYNPNFIGSPDFIDIETFLFNSGKYNAVLLNPLGYQPVSPVVELLSKQRSGLQSGDETERQLDILRKNDIRNEELKYFYRNGVSQQYALSLNGGTSLSSHYFSTGYDQTYANLIGNQNDRLTINSQNVIRLFKKLEINAGLYYSRSVAQVDSTVNGTNGQDFTPYYKFRDENGNATKFYSGYNRSFNDRGIENGFLDWSYVPLNELGLDAKILRNNDLRLNTGVDYQVFSTLKASLKYQYQEINSNSDTYKSIETAQARSLINRYSIVMDGRVSGYNIPIGGVQYNIHGKAVVQSLRAQLDYRQSWQAHGIAAIFGYELSQFDSRANRDILHGLTHRGGVPAEVDTSSVFNLYPAGTGGITTKTNLFGKLDRIRSVFSNIAYSYDNRYTFSVSARTDGSNYFGVKTNQKQVPLWSVGALWNLSHENFYTSEWMPVLKFRASFGYNGNLNKSITGVTTIVNIVAPSSLTNLPYAGISNLGNPDLRWEKIGVANFGLEFSLKNQVLSGKIEYYSKYGTDILGDKAFPSSTGIETLRGNYSEMKINGFDVVLSSLNLNRGLKWQTNFLLSKATDKITLYGVVEAEPVYYLAMNSHLPVVGKSIHGVYSYKWAGLNPLNGNPRGYLNGQITEDYQGIINNTEPTDLIYHGPARPTVFGGFNNVFSFRKLTLGVNISYKFGYYFKKTTVNYASIYQFGLGANLHSDFAKRWKNPGDEKITDVPSMASYTESNHRSIFYISSSATVAKGDHIRLQDVSLSYDLDRSNWKKIPVKQLQVYGYVNNLGLLWKANEFDLDPDHIVLGGDRLLTLNPLSFVLGLKVNL